MDFRASIVSVSDVAVADVVGSASVCFSVFVELACIVVLTASKIFIVASPVTAPVTTILVVLVASKIWLMVAVILLVMAGLVPVTLVLLVMTAAASVTTEPLTIISPLSVIISIPTTLMTSVMIPTTLMPLVIPPNSPANAHQRRLITLMMLSLSVRLAVSVLGSPLVSAAKAASILVASIIVPAAMIILESVVMGTLVVAAEILLEIPARVAAVLAAHVSFL